MTHLGLEGSKHESVKMVGVKMPDVEEAFDGMFLVNELCIENPKMDDIKQLDALIKPRDQKLFDDNATATPNKNSIDRDKIGNIEENLMN